VLWEHRSEARDARRVDSATGDPGVANGEAQVHADQRGEAQLHGSAEGGAADDSQGGNEGDHRDGPPAPVLAPGRGAVDLQVGIAA